MKNILILVMGARQSFFQKELELIKSTWGAKDKLPEGIDLLSYEGTLPEDKDKHSWLDEDARTLHCSTNDSLKMTFLKTCEAIGLVLKEHDYDWILRVNTSTWVNTRLLRKFVDTLAKDDVMYGSDLYSLTEAACPLPLDLYCRGNAILMPKKIAHIILQNSLPLSWQGIVDDVAIGNTVNSWFLIQESTGGQIWSDSYLGHIWGMPHGWFRCSETDFDNRHALCTYYGCKSDDNDDIREYYRDFMTVQLKMYRQRENEFSNMERFIDIMSDADEPELKLSEKYMKDPSVFIGSALHYIPFTKWLSMGRAALYDWEMRNKAIDDKESPYFQQEAYDALHRVPEA